MNFRLKPFYLSGLCALLSPPLLAVEVPIRADSYISTEAGSINSNFGHAATLAANSSTKKALLKFKSLASYLPASVTSSADIEKATLHIWIRSNSDNGLLTISRNSSAWQELAVTGATAPSVAPAPIPFTPATNAPGNFWYEVDVTDIIKTWVDNVSDPRSIMLETTAGEVVIDSKENTDTSHAAHLDITLVGGTGPQGPQGAAGAQGLQGPQGAQGFQGPQGIQGADGAQGSQGPQGFQGADGAQGSQGPQGFQGADGAQGFQGPQGFQGADGAQGSQGPQGTQGADGAQGSQGPQGFQGADGAQGFQGPQGIQGADGAQGSQGPQGFQGADGAQGSQGPQGFQGADGAQGSQGPQGFQGADGAQGPIGLTGATGLQGPTGATGLQGPTGATGLQGPTGPQGANGPAVYSNTGTAIANAKIVKGTVAVSTNTANVVSFSGSAIFSSIPNCTTSMEQTDGLTPTSIKITNLSTAGLSITLGVARTGLLHYICIGN